MKNCRFGDEKNGAGKFMITNEYFRDYRKKIGFTTQNDAKIFLGAKDIVPGVDFEYMKLLNERLIKIFATINQAISPEIKADDIGDFCRNNITDVFEIMKSNDIIKQLNNQGRRPEQVYFSWMRGYASANFFLKSLSLIFGVDLSKMQLIGDDDFKKVETFQRTAKADLEIAVPNNKRIRIEMQSGFTGINDIKQHKVLEAKRTYEQFKVPTMAIHYDLYNGQVAFLRLDAIKESDMNWITRQQMEGQTVFNIDQNYFTWKLTEPPVSFDLMGKELL